jgi:hypothetical protein
MSSLVYSFMNCYEAMKTVLQEDASTVQSVVTIVFLATVSSGRNLVRYKGGWMRDIRQSSSRGDKDCIQSYRVELSLKTRHFENRESNGKYNITKELTETGTEDLRFDRSDSRSCRMAGFCISVAENSCSTSSEFLG